MALKIKPKKSCGIERITKMGFYIETSGNHGKAEEIAVKFAGDMQKNNDDLCYDFLSWIHDLNFTYKVLIFGNHDGNFDEIFKKATEYNDIIFLYNDTITLKGLKIFASPYSLLFGNWWFMLSEEELSNIYNKIPKNTNILLTHSPPFGILDKTVFGISAGSKSLEKKLWKVNNLKYHIYGHIHEAHGTKIINNISFNNVSSCNLNYELTNMPTQINIV